MKTYGQYAYAPPNSEQNPDPRGVWGLRMQPHIAIRAKRHFPRVAQNRQGLIVLADTAEVARDLEWFLDRFPLDPYNSESAEHLRARAQEHRGQEEAVELILGGGHRIDGLREPAKPARDYQLAAADLILTTGRLLVADDIGLGKTLTALLLLRDPNALPALVVTPTHLPKQWLGELNTWMPWLAGHVITTGRPYDPTSRRGVESQPDVLICNYHKLAGWADVLAGQIRTVIFDEVHDLRHSGTAKYTAAGRIADEADYTCGLSATPVWNYGGEIHSIMEILAPGALGTRDEFLREWGGSDMSNGRIRVGDPAALGTYLRDAGLLLRRTRKDVHRELPEPLRIVQPVESDTASLDAVAGDAAAMAQLVLSQTADPWERRRAAGDLDWRLRQATGIDKAPYVAEFVRMLLESEQNVVLFGWHRAVYDIWQRKLADFKPVMYTGSESPTQKQAAVDAFTDGDARVFIMSLRSGAGLDGLQKVCSVAVFGELDWSPEQHTQAIGRLARDGQEATVAAYFLVADHGSDPVIADVLEVKRQQAEPIRDPTAALFTETTHNQDRMKLLAQATLERAKSRGQG